MHISIGPAAVKQAKTSHSLPGLSESYRGSPRQHHCVLCVFSTLPADSHRCQPHAHCLLLFFRWWWCCVVVLTADLPGNPSRTGRSFPPHRPAASCCCHWRNEKNKRGAFSFQPPRCNKTKGFTFLLCWLHPPIMSLFTPPSLPGLKGGRKEIRHSTSFADRVAFPGCWASLLDLNCCLWDAGCIRC